MSNCICVSGFFTKGFKSKSDVLGSQIRDVDMFTKYRQDINQSLTFTGCYLFSCGACLVFL